MKVQHYTHEYGSVNITLQYRDNHKVAAPLCEGDWLELYKNPGH